MNEKKLAEMFKYSDPSYCASLNPNANNETVIVDASLPKKWKCPHCGKTNTLDKWADRTFMEFGYVMRNCDRCMWVHTFKLELTEEFKKEVVEYAKRRVGISTEEKGNGQTEEGNKEGSEER